MRQFRIHPGVLLLLVALVLGALRLGVGRQLMATSLAFGLPVLVGGWLLLRASELSEPARGWAQVTLVVVLGACELAAWRTAVRPAVLSESELSTTQRDVELTVPSGASHLMVELASPSPEGAADADGKVEVTLERASTHRTLDAEFHHQHVRARASKRRGVSGEAIHDSERFHVALPGQGPIKAHLASSSGGMGKHVEVFLFDDPLWARALSYLMLAGVVVGLLLSALRRVKLSGFTPVLGMLAAYGYYLPVHVGRVDRMGSLLGVVVVAVVAGGGGALVLETLARRLWPTERGRDLAAAQSATK